MSHRGRLCCHEGKPDLTNTSLIMMHSNICIMQICLLSNVAFFTELVVKMKNCMCVYMCVSTRVHTVYVSIEQD